MKIYFIINLIILMLSKSENCILLFVEGGSITFSKIVQSYKLAKVACVYKASLV
jgi:hypothetical protein